MTEREPVFGYVYDFEGKKYEARGDNTMIFQHLGAAALYDCMIVGTEDTGVGIAMWNTEPEYSSHLGKAVDAEATLHVNLREPYPFVRRAYEESPLHDLRETDGVPDEWLE